MVILIEKKVKTVFLSGPIHKAFLLAVISLFSFNNFAQTSGDNNSLLPTGTRSTFPSNTPTVSIPVESLPTPPSILPRTSIETAITYTTLESKLNSNLDESQYRDTSFSIPVLGAQIQSWLYRDYENSQHVGYILGTGIGDKKAKLNSYNSSANTNVNILYSKLMAGLSFEKALLNDRLYFGLNSLVMEELWQQNAPGSGLSWSQWSPSIAFSLQLKATLSHNWYALGEAHNQIPMSKNNPDLNSQRLYFGLGYCL